MAGSELQETKEKRHLNTGEPELEPTTRLLRFLYIGNDKNIYISQRRHPVSTENLDVRLSFIKDMVIDKLSSPYEIIKKVMTSNTLPRNDEALLAIAFNLRRVNNIPANDVQAMKTEIYKGLPELLKTDSDLFLFVYLSNKILKDDDSNDQKTSFGRGMRRALFKWYEQKSSLELANMFGRNRGMHGWTHRDIIHMCHMKFDSSTQCDKAIVISTLFQNGSATISAFREKPIVAADCEQIAGINRILEICKLKVNESPEDSADIIRANNFELGHLPVHLISEPKVWDILLPKLTYPELLRIFPTLYSLNMLNSDHVLSKNVFKLLGNKRLIRSSGTHPLEILAIQKSYEKNTRYNEQIKNKWYQQKKVAKHKLSPNPYLVKQFAQSLDHAINHCPQTGCDYFVTLDLRESIETKTVLRMSQITCLDAMVLFGLTLKKREKNTKVYTFTDNKDVLIPVKITSSMKFEKAFDNCQQMAIKKTKQCLTSPFSYVDKKSENTIFITIVDSVTRFARQKEAPMRQFRLYRKTQPHSKFIVLNLHRISGDREFKYEKGILEICGLTPDTWKIINAFATNLFS